MKWQEIVDKLTLQYNRGIITEEEYYSSLETVADLIIEEADK